MSDQKSLSEIMSPNEPGKALSGPVDMSPSAMFMDVKAFEHLWRVAQLFSRSSLVPEIFKGKTENCVIAFNYACRVNMDPFMIMQNMYIIHGKPAIEAKLQIALFNANPGYSNLKYKLDGEGDGLSCYAFAIDKETGDTIKGPVITINMAKAEGWYNKKGSKWQTMPELMIRYRAAAFFIRTFAPETTLGIHTTEELNDQHVIDASDTRDLENSLKDAVKSEPEKLPENTVKTQVTDKEVERPKETPPEKDDDTEEKTSHPWDRKNYINIRVSGFSTFVMKNKETWNEVSGETEKEVREKWSKLYPDAPFVLDKIEDDHEPDEDPRDYEAPDEKEEETYRCGVFGTGPLSVFFMKSNTLDDALKSAQQIWDNPSDYRDDIKSNDSEDAYNKFLKYLVVCADGVEKPIFDIVKKEKPNTGHVNDQRVKCPDDGSRRSVVHCNGTCKNRRGCPAFD